MHKTNLFSYLAISFLITIAGCKATTTKNHQDNIAKAIPIQQTKIVAHRGFSGIAPENTLAAFAKAIDVGAEYFELDVHESDDGELVVIHDNNLARTTSNNRAGEIHQMSLLELNLVKVGYPKKFGDQYKDEKIPTLKEVLELAKSKIKVCIEIKVLGIEEQVLAIVNELKMKDEVILFSFYYPVLAKIRQLDKDIPTLYLIDQADKTTIDYANVIQANAIGVGYSTDPTVEYIQYAHKHGLEVWKWTVNDEDQMTTLMQAGLDGLITDYPDKAMAIQNELF